MRRRFLLLVVLLGAGQAGAAGALLFGIPWGEPISLRACPRLFLQSDRPCWLGEPFVAGSGSKLGHVWLPDASVRPAWAEHATFKLTVDKLNRVQEIQVKTVTDLGRFEVAESISARFGMPARNNLSAFDIRSASWRSAEGTVEMLCKDSCWITFRTLAKQAALDAELAERRRRTEEKPKAP
jgi:hypothetical protein